MNKNIYNKTKTNLIYETDTSPSFPLLLNMSELICEVVPALRVIETAIQQEDSLFLEWQKECSIVCEKFNKQKNSFKSQNQSNNNNNNKNNNNSNNNNYNYNYNNNNSNNNNYNNNNNNNNNNNGKNNNDNNENLNNRYSNNSSNNLSTQYPISTIHFPTQPLKLAPRPSEIVQWRINNLQNVARTASFSTSFPTSKSKLNSSSDGGLSKDNINDSSNIDYDNNDSEILQLDDISDFLDWIIVPWIFIFNYLSNNFLSFEVLKNK